MFIEFEDDGPGMSSAVREKAFDPYFTTKDCGSGLGLSTVFAILSRHGGMVDLRSDEGVGSWFALYFPASSELPAEVTKATQLRLEGQGSILVMEDDPNVQQVFRAALTELGYEVELVCDGEAAIERWFAAREAGQAFDAVIMDLTIPGGMGGKQAMDRVLRRDPEARGIVTSGYSRDAVMSNYRDAGFCAALAKPFTVTGLALLLAQVLEARVSRDPEG